MNVGIDVVTIKGNRINFLLLMAISLCSIFMPLPLLSPILILLFGIMLSILVISVFAPEDFRFLFNIFLLGFFVRAFLSFWFYIVSFTIKTNYSPGFFFPNDGYAYSLQGWEILRFAERGIELTMKNYLTNPNVHIVSGNISIYDFFTSFVYSFTGYSPLSLFFISSLAGSLAALFIYLISKELFSKNVARISCAFAFFWPSFILWSTQNLKEPMIAMFTFMLLWSLFYVYRRLAPGFLLLSIISTLVLFKIGMPYLVIVASMTFFAISFLFINYLSKSKLITLLIMIFLCAALVIILKDKVVSFIFEKSAYQMNKDSVLEFLNFHRSVRAHGRLQFLKSVDISSIGKAIAFTPLGLLYALFAPFPWQLGSMMQIMAIPETILFYILVPFTIKGIVFAYRQRFNQNFLLFSIIFGFLLFLALVEGNTGTLFRHRLIAFYLLLMYASVGIFLKKKKVIKI